MKIRCVKLLPNKQQSKQLGKYYYPGKQVFEVEIGKEYVVFCLEIIDGMAWVNFDSGSNRLSIAPLCLFEVIDGRVSRYWELRIWEENKILFRPPTFFKEFFHDDLAEGIPETVMEFHKVRSMLEAEQLQE